MNSKIPRPSDAVSIEAEQALLGALLLDPKETWDACSKYLLEGGLFTFDAHQAISEAIIDRCQASEWAQAGDPVLIGQALREAGKMPSPVPPELIFGLCRGLGTAANARYYADLLAKLRAQRGNAGDELEALSLRNALDAEETSLENEIHRSPTGWPRLDAQLGGGFAIPSLNILGAAPKSGKSTWAQIVAERHVEAGGFAYFLDLENGRRLFLRRLICRRARLGLKQVVAALKNNRQGLFDTRDDVDRWQQAKVEVREKLGSHLFVESTPPKDLGGRVALARRKAGNRPLLVVIDSLQKLPMNLEERRADVDRWLRLFERWRLEHNAIVLLVSEIKRDTKGNYTAHEAAFKESGGIEYAADLALTLTRPTADEDADAYSTLRVELARDCDEDPRGDVASYRPVFPYYGLEELSLTHEGTALSPEETGVGSPRVLRGRR